MALVLVGFVAFFLASLWVGLRLVYLWWKTRELPELLIGIGVLGIGPVGFGAAVAGSLLREGRPGLALSLAALGSFAAAAGVFAKYLFNSRVYHPESRGVALVVGLAGLYLVGEFALGATRGFAVPDPSSGSYFASRCVHIGALLWGSGEALRYWLLMRRRLALGLADAVVTNRFLLWGVGAGAAGVGSLIGSVASTVTGISSVEIPWVLACSSAHGSVAAVCMFLAFDPPQRYLRWIHAGEAEVAAAH